MTLLEACCLFIAAILAGVLNSLAGGGGLITFSALLIAGVPSISANATSTIASWPGCIASIGAWMLGIKNIHEMDALKVLLLICIDSFAIVIFLLAGVVAWSPAILMMVGTVIGGYGGAYYARQLKPRLVKGFVITVGFGMTGYFFLHG